MKLAFKTLAFLLIVTSTSARLGEDNVIEEDDGVHGRYLKAGNSGKKIRDQFIVKLSKTAEPRGLLNAMTNANPNARILHEYSSAYHGFAVSGMPEAAIRNLMRKNPDAILEVQEDSEVELDVVWGLDRIDDRSGFDGSFASDFDGAGVDIYILDTGVRSTHNEFGGRVKPGKDVTGEGNPFYDGNGHGTHVAGTAAGGTYGVAKGANIIPVKVLNSSGSGSGAGVIAGIDWVKQQHQSSSSKRSVANMSLGGGFYAAENEALNNAVAAGVVFVVAAGNSNANACNYSPASASEALTVGSTTQSDARSSFSNKGSCVDIFAPGSGITSAWTGSDSGTRTISGTSMASPHVAGAAALLLESDPSTNGIQAANTLKSMATANAISDVGSGSPNKFLYTNDIVKSVPPPSGDTSVTMRVVYDDYPEETHFALWSWYNDAWHMVEYVPRPTSNPGQQSITSQVPDGYYAFSMYDDWGDGVCCAYGNGSFSLKDGAGQVFASGGDFDSYDQVDFRVVNGKVVPV